MQVQRRWHLLRRCDLCCPGGSHCAGCIRNSGQRQRQPQNIMIILTDGEANASASKMNASTQAARQSRQPTPFRAAAQRQASRTTHRHSINASKPSRRQTTPKRKHHCLCRRYGSESSGCTTDSSGPQANITPCQVMSEMASGPQYFYSDYTQSGSGSTCVSTGTQYLT